MKRLILFGAFTSIYLTSLSNDTTWLNNKWKQCGIDTASYFSTAVKEDSLFHRRIYYWPSGKIYLDGVYKDRNFEFKNGWFLTYSTSGKLLDSARYSLNYLSYRSQWYENGQKKKEARYKGPPFRLESIEFWTPDGKQADVDTTYADNYRRVCHPDTAKLIEIITRKDAGFLITQQSLKPGGEVAMYEYADRRFEKFNWFRLYRNNRLRDSVIYNANSGISESYGYHSNGRLAFIRLYDSSGKFLSIKIWNEEGKQTSGIRYARYAEPTEGFRTWQRRLLKKINNDPSIPAKERKQLYGSVYIGFVVDEDGKVVDVHVREPSIYPQMDAIILNACTVQETWKPFLLNGRREKFIAVHSFSFVKGKVIKYQTLY